MIVAHIGSAKPVSTQFAGLAVVGRESTGFKLDPKMLMVGST